MDEILKTATEIIFTCAMGEEISSWEIDFWENGKCSKRDATFVMRHTTARYFERAVQPHIILFPSLGNLPILPFEREIALNAASCRACIHKLLEKRRG